jgi:hypothetical protein
MVSERRLIKKIVNRANFKTIKKRHTGESQCPENSQKYWIALRLRLAAWKTALRV